MECVGPKDDEQDEEEWEAVPRVALGLVETPVAVTRGLLGNAHHELLSVDGILQVSMRHRIPSKRKARFTQVRGPR
jgi:hypothetical protein